MLASRAPLAESNARLAAARRLTRRAVRRETGRFLAEGPQAVREALARPDVVVEIFATAEALSRHASVVEAAAVPVAQISRKAAAALSETVHPQGIVAVCRRVDVPLADAFARRPRLGAALVEPNDPGNLGAILRTADAAGADAVAVGGGGVDVYNGKAVRASAGSLFHLDVVVDVVVADLLTAARSAGLLILATTSGGSRDLDDVPLAEPTLWLFGNEARGLPASVVEAADENVRVPIYGRAESLNLAAATALCLYASARAQVRPPRAS
jgi:RNA methyltransferase, TrmH family